MKGVCMKRFVVLMLCVAVVVLPARSSHLLEAGAQPADKAALERARKQVKMLDDIYKNTIVAITSQYVKDENSYPAGRVAIKLFKAISEGGHHHVKLLDVSGKPSNPKNVATDDFEKKGVQELKAGKQYYEE